MTSPPLRLPRPCRTITLIELLWSASELMGGPVVELLPHQEYVQRVGDALAVSLVSGSGYLGSTISICLGSSTRMRI
jgi:hypothetical protein